MKLKLPLVCSQRDPKWANTLLGYNTNAAYTIGGFGCLIASLGMYVNKLPLEVNELLKQSNGFAPGGGNFVWSKSSALGLTQNYQSPYYSDAVTAQGLSKMRELLDEGRPLITHIDFDPRDADDDQHWLLIYGYDDNDVFYAADPWTGTLITLDVYGGVKRCVYEWRAYEKMLEKDDGIDYKKLYDEAYQLRNQYHNDRMAMYEELGFTGLFNLTVAIEKIKMQKNLEQQVKERDATIEAMKLSSQEIEGKFEKLTGDHEKMRIENAKLVVATKEAKEANDKLTTQATANETKMQQMGGELTSVKVLFEDFKKLSNHKMITGWKRRLHDLLVA